MVSPVLGGRANRFFSPFLIVSFPKAFLTKQRRTDSEFHLRALFVREAGLGADTKVTQETGEGVSIYMT